MKNGIIVTLALLTLTAGIAFADLHGNLEIGTNDRGSLFYTLSGGIAKVVSEHSALQLRTAPYPGNTQALADLNSGKIAFGMNNAVDAMLAYEGPAKAKVGGKNDFPHAPNLRLAMRGSPIYVSFITRTSLGIHSVAELRGKRVAGVFTKHLALRNHTEALLANAGLKAEDVKLVTVDTVNGGVNALFKGEVDAAAIPIGSPKVKEADSFLGGVTYLSGDCGKEGRERLHKDAPGYYTEVVKDGKGAGVHGNTCFIVSDTYLLTQKDAPANAVQEILKAIFANHDQLSAIHPLLQDWSKERAVDPGVTLPYHPAAVALYKEMGLWNAKMDEAQKRLLH